MPLYDFKCPDCTLVAELTLPMARSSEPFLCSCGGKMTRIFTTYPHTKLNWKAFDRNETGNSRMTIGAATAGKITPMDDAAQGYRVKVHDDARQS